jgi:NarL family two-component system sensor histidine kinase LiaS
MKKRFSSIRYIFIRSHLSALLFTTVTLLAILLSIHVLLDPQWLTPLAIFLFTGLYFFIGLFISVYMGFTASGNLKSRIDSLSVLITQFANGNYQSSVYFEEEDEITRIGNDLNELGRKLLDQVKSLQRMADEKSELAKSAHKSAVIEERQRLARDLHDAVSQQLFALTMMSEAAVKQLDRNPIQAKDQMKEVSRMALQAQTEMRALLLHLRPVHLSGEPLHIGIRKLVSELETRSSIDFTMEVEEDLVLSDTTEDHVFRIIQEAFSNILRHANAKEVNLQLKNLRNELFLHIRDDGNGFDVSDNRDNKASYGLKTMRERAEELGGTLQLRSKQGEGTYIDLRIPY